MELYEFLLYTYGRKNDDIFTYLNEHKNNLLSEGTDENTLRSLYIAMGLAKGYTLYQSKKLAKELGVTKTALRYMANSLIDEGKAEILKENNITFIKPVF